MLLSILIPSITSRKEKLDILIDKINKQIGSRTDIEIITQIDDCVMPIGSKRNMLLYRSKAKYICFVDDDDDISDDYINLILPGIEQDKDCCSLNGKITFSDGYSRVFIHSLKYPKWVDNHKEKVYYRPPNHLNVIKRELALKAGFPSIKSGEDRIYSMKVQPHIKTEYEVPGILYYYRCGNTFEKEHHGLSRDYEGVSE